jgi:IS5 family transposase
VKVSVATTNAKAPAGQFVVGMRALPGNPYDGHTLAAQMAQTERITGVTIERAYVDRGYRGHDADRARVFITRQKRGLTPTIRRELRRRAGIEPVIGHAKADGLLGRNFLLGPEGDAVNAMLAGAGHNLRLLRRWLAQLLALFLRLLLERLRRLMSAPMPAENRLLHA